MTDDRLDNVWTHKEESVNRLLLAVGLAIAFVVGIFFSSKFIDSNRQPSELDQAAVGIANEIVSGQPRLLGVHGSSTYPISLAEMVEVSPVIVVARFVEATAQATITLATAEPLSNLPDEEFPVVHTEFVVDEVLKGGEEVEVNDHVIESNFASMPVTSPQISSDAEAGYQILWPVDTEFILFLDKEEGIAEYLTVYGKCGRVLTDGESVACSDGDRTVLDFMSGLSREDYIEAIVEEVDYPSDTPTPWPSWTPEPTYTPGPTWTPTRTPTPCAGPGC